MNLIDLTHTDNTMCTIDGNKILMIDDHGDHRKLFMKGWSKGSFILINETIQEIKDKIAEGEGPGPPGIPKP
jgi:hypothetical protein